MSGSSERISRVDNYIETEMKRKTLWRHRNHIYSNSVKYVRRMRVIFTNRLWISNLEFLPSLPKYNFPNSKKIRPAAGFACVTSFIRTYFIWKKTHTRLISNHTHSHISYTNDHTRDHINYASIVRTCPRARLSSPFELCERSTSGDRWVRRKASVVAASFLYSHNVAQQTNKKTCIVYTYKRTSW